MLPEAAVDDEHVNTPYELIDEGPANDADETVGNDVEELDNYELEQA